MSLSLLPNTHLPGIVKPAFVPQRTIVINVGLRPFALSERANRALIRARVPGVRRDAFGRVSYVGLRRDQPALIQVVSDLGQRAAVPGVTLRLVKIPLEDAWGIRTDLQGAEEVEHRKVEPR